ncbi:MAG TPA: CBS domain-containing protein [Methylomirabilota bacterium]|jgi:CBS domain-containing protein|nr:CBS domain-containing protein [Methylomirabilota bacterium]
MLGKICTTPATTASPDTTVREAAHRMRTRKIGALVIVNGRKEPLGVLTDRDITVNVVAQGADPAQVRVGAMIKRKPAVIRDSAGILDATKLMSRRGVRRLPVVNASGQVIGVLSLDDLLMLLGSELANIASTLSSELGRARI